MRSHLMSDATFWVKQRHAFDNDRSKVRAVMNDVTLLFDASEQGSGNTLCLEFQNDVFMFAQLFISPLCLYLSPQHRENIKSIFHSKELTFATLEYVCYRIQISSNTILYLDSTH